MNKADCYPIKILKSHIKKGEWVFSEAVGLFVQGSVSDEQEKCNKMLENAINVLRIFYADKKV